MWRHRSVSLNNEKICCEISEDKIAFCEKTAGLRRGKFSDSNSACLKVLVPVKIFQFQDMLNESERYQDAANGLRLRDVKWESRNTNETSMTMWLDPMIWRCRNSGK